MISIARNFIFLDREKVEMLYQDTLGLEEDQDSSLW